MKEVSILSVKVDAGPGIRVDFVINGLSEKLFIQLVTYKAPG